MVCHQDVYGLSSELVGILLIVIFTYVNNLIRVWFVIRTCWNIVSCHIYVCMPSNDSMVPFSEVVGILLLVIVTNINILIRVWFVIRTCWNIVFSHINLRK